MQRAVINLFDRWQLTDEQASTLLGDIATRTYQRWKVKQYGRVSVDLAARLSNLLGVHKALRLLFTDANRGYGWIKRPNKDFGGETALQIMLHGQLTDLMRVRRYLDAQRGSW
ncbi:MbcA/ParS/Xre antitoxin family protein [Pseudovibrio axinellae]|nr:MbcA/ParS/Xre antitoxin family protein [Pseudovibrio axinellae]